MKAIRQIKEVKAGAITVDLPYDDTNSGGQSLQDMLLDAPTITDDELQEFNSVRDWMSQWNVKTF